MWSLLILSLLLGAEPNPILRLADPGPTFAKVPRQLAWSPDGKTLAVVPESGEVTLFDATTLAKTGTVAPATHYPPAFLGWSPDGRALAISYKRGELWLHGLAGEAPRRLQDKWDESVRAIVFLPDGKKLVWAGSEGGVRLVDLASGKVERQWWPDAKRLSALSVSPDGKTIVAGGRDGVRVFTIHSDKLRTFDLKPSGSEPDVAALAFSRDGKTLYGAGLQLGLHVWDVPSGTLGRTLFGPAVSFAVTSSAVVLPDDDDLVAFDPSTFEVRLSTSAGSDPSLVTASPDGRSIAFVDERSGLRVVDAATLEPKSPPAGHTAAVRALCFGGTYLASAGPDGLFIWDPGSGRLLKHHRLPLRKYMPPMVCGDGEVHLEVDPKGKPAQVMRIDLATGGLTPSQQALPRAADEVAATTREGGRLTSASRDEVTLSDASGAVQTTFRGELGRVTALAVSPDGLHFAAGGKGGVVLLWRL